MHAIFAKKKGKLNNSLLFQKVCVCVLNLNQSGVN